MSIFATFNGLMMGHDVCSISFSEIHRWTKKSVKHINKKWKIKEIDWSKCNPRPPPRHHVTFGSKMENISPTCFGRWIQTA